VETDASWKIAITQSEDSWLTVTPMEGMGNATVASKEMTLSDETISITSTLSLSKSLHAVNIGRTAVKTAKQKYFKFMILVL